MLPIIYGLTHPHHGAQLISSTGFSGKQIIHLNQVEVTQETFTPSDEAIVYAKRAVESFETSQRQRSRRTRW